MMGGCPEQLKTCLLTGSTNKNGISNGYGIWRQVFEQYCTQKIWQQAKECQ